MLPTHLRLMLLFICLLPVLSASAGESVLWFDRFTVSADPTANHAVVRAVADHLIHQRPLFLPPETSGGVQVAFVTVSDGLTAGQVSVGVAIGLSSAVEQAATEARHTLLTGPVRWVKVDVVSAVARVEGHAVDTPLDDERSLWGLAFSEAGSPAFLPEELVSYTLLNSDNQLVLSNLRQRIGLALQGDTLDLYRFSTLSYFSDGDEVVPLYRGHRWFASITPERALEAARAGGDYLVRAVRADGSFIYSYRPKTGGVPDDYNILRHAGTLYSMLELYGVTGDPTLRAAADRAAAYLLAQVQPCLAPVSGAASACVVEDDEVKLGGNALAVVALVEYARMTGDNSLYPTLEALGDWMVGAQYPDGRFAHKIMFSTGEIDGFISQYYPGEAILALARLYTLIPEERWLDAAEAGALYLITVRDAGKAISELAHDHWLLYGLNDLYRLRPDPAYLLHTRRIVRAIIDSQHQADGLLPRDWAGGYYHPPRSTPTATRSEGLCAAYQLLTDFGSAGEAAQAWRALVDGLRFQLQTQFLPEKALYLENPSLVLGGFHASLTNFEVRVDYVQHNISSLLCAHRYFPAQ